MVRIITLFIFAFLITTSCASASIVRTSGYYTGGGAVSETVVLTISPRNGDQVVVIDISNATGGTAPTKITDSHGVSLNLNYSVSGSAYGIYTYSYFVSGSPTSTFTCTINASGSCVRLIAVELIGTYNDTPTYNGLYGTSITPTSNAVSTNAGDFLICMAVPTTQTISISNSTGLTTIGATNEAYAFATSTTSTCTGSASATNAAASMADYPLGPTSGCGPYPYPCIFQT